jgi:hypothetical protein
MMISLPAAGTCLAESFAAEAAEDANAVTAGRKLPSSTSVLQSASGRLY